MSHDATPGRSAVRFTIPDAFADNSGDDLVIEMRAFVGGPRGGKGQELSLPADYWTGILKKLAQKGITTA